MGASSDEGSGVRISQSPQVALGRAIRLRREEIKLTQEALADAADLDPTSVRGLERGVGNPTWDVADRVARALGLALHGSPAELTSWRPTIDDQPISRSDRANKRGPPSTQSAPGCRSWLASAPTSPAFTDAWRRSRLSSAVAASPVVELREGVGESLAGEVRPSSGGRRTRSRRLARAGSLRAAAHRRFG